MKTTRTRMLIVFAAAAVVISFFMNLEDMRQGFIEGFNDGAHGGPPPIHRVR